MQPRGDLILIDVDPPREKTASGILIAEEWKTLPPVGTIAAVGEAVDDDRLQPGTRVLFERYASVILDKNQRLCKQRHVLAIIDEADDAAL